MRTKIIVRLVTRNMYHVLNNNMGSNILEFHMKQS